MAEALAALTTAIAALNGLIAFINLLFGVYTRIRWGTSIYDVVDTLYESGKNPYLREAIIIAGGQDLLNEMDAYEGDAKKAVQELDISKTELLKIAYESKKIWEAHKRRAIYEKERDRQAAELEG